MEVLHWSCFASNRFWRTVYGRGIWLTREEAKAVVRDGWAFVAVRPQQKETLFYVMSGSQNIFPLLLRT